MPELMFRRYDTAGARAVRDTVALVYSDSHVEQISTRHPFYTEEAATLARFDAYTSREGFDLVIGYQGVEPVCQAWGWALGAGTGWWQGLRDEPEPNFTIEDGTRTFAFSELMIRPAWTGRGIAHALHDDLLAARTESRATLLVRPDNTTAYQAYTRWGWRKAAELRPNMPNAPWMHVLMLSLPVKR